MTGNLVGYELPTEIIQKALASIEMPKIDDAQF